MEAELHQRVAYWQAITAVRLRTLRAALPVSPLPFQNQPRSPQVSPLPVQHAEILTEQPLWLPQEDRVLILITGAQVQPLQASPQSQQVLIL